LKKRRKQPELELLDTPVLLAPGGDDIELVTRPTETTSSANNDRFADEHSITNNRNNEQLESLQNVVDTAPEEQVAGLPNLPSRYIVTGSLGEGGMAHVLQAIDNERGGIEVAVKILRSELARDPGVVERFFREARAVQKVPHPNLVQVFDCATADDGTPYMVMELIRGEDLSQLLKKETQLPVARSLNIFRQLCDGLIAAHDAGLVHRDVKPSNILVYQDSSGNEKIKLVDFGIAKPSSYERAINPALTHTGSILGSPAYMSPEQCQGHAVDERSDVYSLGCVMYETLTGRSPFAADTPVKSILLHIEQRPEPFEIEFSHLKIPATLEDIVMRCLEKEPKDRYQKAYLVHDALTTAPAPGIFRRSASFIVDTIILVALMMAVSCITAPFSNEEWWQALLWFLSVTAAGLYFAGFEASRLQASPGKLLLGLKVYKPDGGRVNFWDSLACSASVSCILTIITTMASGVLLFYFGKFNHYSLATSTLFLTPMWFVILNGLPSAFNHGRQDGVDSLFKRVIARSYTAIETPPQHRPAWTSVLLSLTFLAATALYMPVFQQAGKQLFENGPSVVVVASKPISPGTVITKDMLRIAHTLPILNTRYAKTDPNSLIGRVADRYISSMDAVTETSLKPPTPNNKQ
jgi:Protein kinase domain/RDD family/SAF domain